MRFSEEILEKVREASDIVEVVGEHVTLKKSGQNFKGLCPFHSERTPSFTVSATKQVYHCFGCGAGGNVFSFVMQLENLSFVEAVRSLAKRKGIELPVQRAEADSARARLLSAVGFAVSFYRKQLDAAAGRKAREYLKARAIGDEVCETFSLGYAPAGWDALIKAASRHTSEEVLLQAGLVVPRERGSGSYDRFRDRLMFPILSPGGKPIGFGARALGETQPKYLNSSDSPVFQKGSVLYGLYQSKQAIRARESATVVEGYTDLLSLFQNGFQNVVASCGTAFTAEQARLLKRYTREAVLVYDGDEAGIQAARRALQVFLEAGVRVRVACLPAGHDPDSFLRERGARALSEALESPWSLSQFLLKTAPQNMRREDRIRSLVDVFALIEDPIYRRVSIQEAAEVLKFDENTIAYEVGRTRKRGRSQAEPASLSSPEVDRVERELIKLMLENGTVLKAARESLEERYFNSETCRAAFRLLKGFDWEREAGPAELLDSADSADVRGLLSSALLEEAFDFDEPLEVFADYHRKLRHRWLTESIKSLEEEIRKKEKGSDERELRRLFEKLQALASQRSSLNGENRELSGSSIQSRRGENR
ncbi:MAG: DNA primase [Candidatus Eiseniibacteriota bacterium]|nr:MAG: DNA primase [Candidatus Eisenbacteria bacterium]